MFKPDLPTGQNPPTTATIHVSAGAGELVSADIPIDLALDLQLSAEVVNGERELGGQEAYPVFVVRFDVASKQWKLGEVVIYFHAPRSETPVQPSFVPAWDKVMGAPDYLDFDTPLSDDGNLTWRIHPKVRQGVQLPDDWLLSGGKVVLTISCKEQGPMA
jgi:hypothetical protein